MEFYKNAHYVQPPTLNFEKIYAQVKILIYNKKQNLILKKKE